ncbi:MAG: hypothetical protein ABIE70_05310 [bacterium]
MPPASNADDSSAIAPVGSGSVPVTIRIDLPGCRYRRADERLKLKSNITLSGIDVDLRLRGADSTIRLSHHNLAARDIKRNSHGDILAKRAPDTTMQYTLRLDRADTLDLGLVVYAAHGRRFTARDHVKPTTRQYRIPAALNQGRPVQVELRIDQEGEIIVRYW